MYEEKYKKLKELRKKCIIGVIILLVVFVIIIGIAVYGTTNIEIINKIENPIIPTAIMIVFYVVLLIVIAAKFIEPHRLYRIQLSNEIKNDILGRKISNSFGPDYKIEDPFEFYEELKQINFARHYPVTNNKLALKYNNIRLKYVYCDIYQPDDDGVRRFFRGDVFVFNLKESISGDLYIGKKEKFILGDISELENLISYNSNIKEIKPTNSILKDTIEVRSSSYCNLIDNQPFQETLNNIFETEINFLIYRDNKVFVFVNNKEELFNIKIDNSSKEQQAEVLFEQDVEKLKQRLNEVLKYKDSLYIGE